jgi:hypothetical protein
MESSRTTEERIADFSTRPDAVLFNSTEVGPRVVLFTIPLLGVPRNLDDEPPLVGSGVFVHLADRYFVFTAGHVIEALLPTRDSHFFAVYGVHRHLRTCPPCRFNSRYVHKRSIDFGYVEISPKTANDWRSERKAWLSHRLIRVATAAELQDDDHFVVSGVPDALTVRTGDAMKLVTLTHFMTSLAGQRGAPPSQWSPESGVECLDLSFDPSVLTTRMIDGKHEPAELLVDTSCMSGGPCWKGNVMPDPSVWRPERMELVATHCGKLVGYEDGDRTFTFARQMLIGNHLRLLATDYAGTSLERFLFERWPQLRYWPEF